MRLEWQATREINDRKVSVRLAVEVDGQLASDAKRATQYLDQARQTLDLAFWEDDPEPRAENPRQMDDPPQDRQGQGQDPGRPRT